MPTVLDLLGIAERWPLDGRSALGDSPPVYPEGLPFLVASIARGAERTLVRLSPSLHQVKYATHDWQRELLVEWDDGRWSFGPRPYRALVGRSLEEFEVAPAEKVSLRVVPPKAGDSWRFVRGLVKTSDSETRLDLALARDGRIVAGTQAIGHGGVLLFTALLPRAADAGEATVVDFLLIREAVSGIRLERLTLDG